MRNVGLELTRGLAALVVMLNHSTAIPGVRDHLGKWAMLLNWGTEAVIVFFLLS
jgi:peptidoglycan/LPS O-acetylase OafA/YrhL